MLRVVLIALASLVVLQVEAKAPPVKVDLYYEVLCPYCQQYFIDQLYPTYLELKSIMKVGLYPFGNAQYTPKPEGGYTFKCQHGLQECRGNMIHACAQIYVTEFDKEMDFVNCLLKAANPGAAGYQCAKQNNITWSPIGECVNSVEGENALYNVAKKQEQLDPALYFTPWILVDDTFSEDQVGECQTNMHAVVCDRYTGVKPLACHGQNWNYLSR